MTTHSSTLAWEIPWTEEPDRLQSMESLRVWTQLSDFTFTFHFHALEKEMATRSSVLARRIPGTGEPGELPSMGSHRVGQDWSDLAAARYFLTSYFCIPVLCLLDILKPPLRKGVSSLVILFSKSSHFPFCCQFLVLPVLVPLFVTCPRANPGQDDCDKICSGKEKVMFTISCPHPWQTLPYLNLILCTPHFM